MIPHGSAQPGLSYLKLQARPGSVQPAGTIELLNPTAHPMRVLLTLVNGMTLDTLGSTYAPASSGAHGATRWLRVSRRAFTLAPHGKATTTVLVRVPPRARAGDYLSGLSIEALHQSPKAHAISQGAAAVSTVRYAIGVETVLPGRRRPLIRFSGAAVRRDPAGLSFLLNAHNSGNAILQNVRGHVQIVHRGHIVLSRAIPSGTFLAHTSIAYPVPALRRSPPEGTRYHVTAWLRYHGGVARLNTTVVFGRRAAAVQRSYSGRTSSGGGSSWWKDALFAAVVLYMAFTTVLLLRRRHNVAGAERVEVGSLRR